jgi:hypothetical protein
MRGPDARKAQPGGEVSRHEARATSACVWIRAERKAIELVSEPLQAAPVGSPTAQTSRRRLQLAHWHDQAQAGASSAHLYQAHPTDSAAAANPFLGCAGQATSSGRERSRADSRRDRSVDPRNQAVADAVGVFPVPRELLPQCAVFEGRSHHGYDDRRRRWNKGPHRAQCQCHGERGQNAS